MIYGIITRIYIAELPYLKSFIEHHINIGISYIYFLNTIQEQYKTIYNFLNTFKNYTDNIILIHRNYNNNIFNGSQFELLEHIPHKNIILFNIDLDEYIDLKDISILDNLNYNNNFYSIRWISHFTNENSLNFNTKCLFKFKYKSFGMIKFIRNNYKHTECPDHFLGHNSKQIVLDDITLIHYNYRSLMDLCNRLIYGKCRNELEGNHKTNNKSRFFGINMYCFSDLISELNKNTDPIYKSSFKLLVYISTILLNSIQFMDNKIEYNSFILEKNVNSTEYLKINVDLEKELFYKYHTDEELSLIINNVNIFKQKYTYLIELNYLNQLIGQSPKCFNILTIFGKFLYKYNDVLTNN